MPSKETIDRIIKGIGLELFPEQLEILNDPHRVIQIKGGWRASKSTVSALYLLTRYWLGDYYAIIGADYELCRPEFGYLVEWGYKLGIVRECHFPSKDQCMLKLSRGEGASPAIIETKSAKYPERIAGKAYDGALLVEAAQMSSEIFDITQGRLVERDGWMVMSGTLEVLGDWYVDKAREYALPDNADGGVSYSLPSWANKRIFPGGRNDPKLLQQEASLGKDDFLMRYAGEIVRPVYIGVDPGYYPSAYAVMFVQYVNDEVYVIDEVYQQDLITEQILTIVEHKPFYDKIEDGAIDRAAKQRGEKPVHKQWLKTTGLNLHTTYFQDVTEGVDRLKSFFIPDPVHGNVRIHINRTCKGLISELGGCKSPFADEGRGSWRLKPSGKPSEKNCDAIKALIYEVVRMYGLAPRRRGAAVSYPKEVTV